MVFSSHVFLFGFLPIALALYYLAPPRARNLVLTATSYVFYGWAAPYFIFLIAWSTIVDYTCGNFIYGHWRLPGFSRQTVGDDPQAFSFQRKLFVGLSLASNIGMLGFFKYFTFAEENVNALLQAFGREAFPLLLVTLPVGISFYTFESISYILDIYFGRARPAIVWVEQLSPSDAPAGPWRQLWMELKALNAFACYITQFPHLVAGPIIRYQDLERQIHARTHTIEKFGRGICFFALGLAKKTLLANPLGDVADAAFEAHALPLLDSWFGLFAYAFQIYFDFSGYSDMAIGLGLMLGFEFNKNFDSPYKSQSITEFWRRWHISLSTWLRDYLYVPLGGNRGGAVRTYRNLLVVMMLGGLWHGASWNFLVWGAIHGVWLCVERLQGKASFYSRWPPAIRTALTFVIVNIAWVFFRAPDLASSIRYLKGMAGLQHPEPAALLLRAIFYSPFHLLIFAAAAVISFGGVQTWDFVRRVTPLKAAAAVAALLWAVVAMSTQAFNPFLYFRF
ncbi:MAG: MBOAT family O-acyltransferase [Vicinamibacterales bacterium]